MNYEAVAKLMDLQLVLNLLEGRGEHPRLDPGRQCIVCTSGEVYYDMPANRWYINVTKEEGTER